MRFFFKLVLALLACILVPCIIVVAATSSVFNNIYQENIVNSQVNRLVVVENTNNLIIESMEQNALAFIQDNNVRALGQLKSIQEITGSSLYPVSAMRIVSSLSDMVTSNELYDSVYFYVEGSDYIASSRNGIARVERFADTAWLEQYRQILEGHGPAKLMPARPVYTSPGTDGGYAAQCVTYLYPVTRYTSAFDGVLVFNLYEEKLLELYAGQSADSNITMLDETGALYFGVGGVDYQAILEEYGLESLFAAQTPASGSYQADLSGEKFLCTWLRLADSGLMLFSVDDISMLKERQISFQFFLLVLILVLVPTASLLVVLLSRRLYSPINELMRELQAGNRLDVSGERDELSAISRAIKELMREENSLFSSGAREKHLAEAVRNILDGKEVPQVKQELMPHSRNICILAVPDDAGVEKQKHFDTRLRLLSRLIQEELSGETLRATTQRHEGDMLVTILSVDDAIDDLEAFLLEGISLIQGMDILGVPVTFSVGGLSDNLTSLRQSYDEAKAALQLRFIKGPGSILFYDLLAMRSQVMDATDRIREICRCLGEGRKAEMLDGISRLIGDIRGSADISFVNVTQILNALLEGLTQFVDENHIQVEELMAESSALYRGLWQNSTLEEAGKWLEGVFATVIDYQHVAKDSGCEYVKSTLEYVRENYDKDITIDTIAAHIGISYSYLRKVFKDATGQNLADYISSLRIGKAKTLLQTTNHTVREIASMCGYNHERSFSRSFTQAEGLSPGKYKARMTTGVEKEPVTSE